MVESSTPDLLRVAGLVFFMIGMLLLGKVVTSYAHMASSEAARQELTANRRHVGMWFCMPVIVVGLLFQITSEFFSGVPSHFLALSFLILAFWLLAFALIGDYLADRMHDTKLKTTQRRSPRPKLPVRYLPRQTVGGGRPDTDAA